MSTKLLEALVVVAFGLVIVAAYLAYRNRSFLKGVFMDGDKPSFSRTATAVIVLFSLSWVSYIVLRNGALPPASDIAALAGFDVVLYGANVAKQFAP